MRDNVEAFVRRGGNLAVFSGNTCWWQVRLEDDGRTMVCYRDAVADPMSTVEPGLGHGRVVQRAGEPAGEHA